MGSQYRDKTVTQPFHLYNHNSYSGNAASLHWTVLYFLITRTFYWEISQSREITRWDLQHFLEYGGLIALRPRHLSNCRAIGTLQIRKWRIWHHGDVTINIRASHITCSSSVFFNCLFSLISRKISKPVLLVLWEGNSPVTDEFPPQRPMRFHVMTSSWTLCEKWRLEVQGLGFRHDLPWLNSALSSS